ncbi:hypothetical protein [Chelativorans alearense]|uniref:hypothetical protein n=1 Tax=Chelativorans alearense TaxID=2681495 RepID=UPI0013D59BE5|nr:hypothetical protein [Chelativorans alearense]
MNEVENVVGGQTRMAAKGSPARSGRSLRREIAAGVGCICAALVLAYAVASYSCVASEELEASSSTAAILDHKSARPEGLAAIGNWCASILLNKVFGE